jgi:hypothetical protein
MHLPFLAVNLQISCPREQTPVGRELSNSPANLGMKSFVRSSRCQTAVLAPEKSLNMLLLSFPKESKCGTHVTSA